jgi:hypothetical protein
MTNCMTKLAECGYAHPGNTGVPAGVTLTAYSGPSRITTAGTVIDGKTTGCLEIAAANVVIKNSKISGPCAFAVKTTNGGSVTVQDSEIDCVDYKGMGVAGSNATTLRSEIRRCENGFHVNSNVVIQDNYITEVVEVDGGHGDGVQASSGSNVTIRHNTFNLRNPITSSMIMDELVINNLLVEDNFFSAGAYTIYCPDSGTNMVYRNNRFYGPVGQWNSDPNRPAFGFRTNCGNATWTGNYRDDNLAAVS